MWGEEVRWAYWIGGGGMGYDGKHGIMVGGRE